MYQKLFLHDAELLLTEVNGGESSLKMIFRRESNDIVCVNFFGVRAFRCVDLGMQNVISRVIQSSHGKLILDDLKYWLGWVTSFSDSRTWLNESQFANTLQNCIEGNLELLIFEPSAGAEFAVLCEKVELE